MFLSHGHARISLLLHLLFFFSFLRGDDVHSLRIQSGGSSISHNAIPPKVYDSRNWRISRSSSSSSVATSPRSAVRSRRIVERSRGVTKKKKKKKSTEASLTTGETGENFLLVMWAPLHFVFCLFGLFMCTLRCTSFYDLCNCSDFWSALSQVLITKTERSFTPDMRSRFLLDPFSTEEEEFRFAALESKLDVS